MKTNRSGPILLLRLKQWLASISKGDSIINATVLCLLEYEDKLLKSNIVTLAKSKETGYHVSSQCVYSSLHLCVATSLYLIKENTICLPYQREDCGADSTHNHAYCDTDTSVKLSCLHPLSPTERTPIVIQLCLGSWIELWENIKLESCTF